MWLYQGTHQDRTGAKLQSKSSEGGFKTDGRLDGAHAEVHTIPGQVMPALLKKDPKNIEYRLFWRQQEAGQVSVV